VKALERLAAFAPMRKIDDIAQAMCAANTGLRGEDAFKVIRVCPIQDNARKLLPTQLNITDSRSYHRAELALSPSVSNWTAQAEILRMENAAQNVAAHSLLRSFVATKRSQGLHGCVLFVNGSSGFSGAEQCFCDLIIAL
jgi:hypothetical protein